jgi:two-component system nitrate/nitrite response regulator NarL
MAQMLVSFLRLAGHRSAAATFASVPRRAAELGASVLVVDGEGEPAEVRERGRALRRDLPRARIILLVDGDTWDPGRIREAGAHSCVSRRGGGQRLLAALRAPVRGPAHGLAHDARRTPREHQAADDPLAALTAREREVLQALLAGLRDPEIAEALRISRHTVRTHLQHAFAKLAVSTRHEAAVVALGAGLSPLPVAARPTSA